jgi:hypothetical protein
MCIPFSDELEFFDKFFMKGGKIIDEDPSCLVIDLCIIWLLERSFLITKVGFKWRYLCYFCGCTIVRELGHW